MNPEQMDQEAEMPWSAADLLRCIAAVLFVIATISMLMHGGSL